jgi:PEP-CTERM motif
MIRSLAAFLIALLMMGALALPAQADTITSSGTLTGTSTITATSNPAVFDSSFTGSGTDSVSGPFTGTNMATLNFTSLTTFTSSGTFVNVLAGGTLFGTFTGSGTGSGDTTAITIDSVITGGTGIFAGDRGKSTITGISTTTSPTMSSFTGTYTTSITTVPEPGSVTLLLAGIGFLLVMRKRWTSDLRPAS